MVRKGTKAFYFKIQQGWFGRNQVSKKYDDLRSNYIGHGKEIAGL